MRKTAIAYRNSHIQKFTQKEVYFQFLTLTGRALAPYNIPSFVKPRKSDRIIT